MQRSSNGDGDKQSSFASPTPTQSHLVIVPSRMDFSIPIPGRRLCKKNDLYLVPSMSRNIETCDVFENYGTLASVPFLQMKLDSCKLASFYTFKRDVISPDPSHSITVSNVIPHSIFNQIRQGCENQRCNIASRNPRLHLTSSEDDQKRRENSRKFHDFVSELGRYDLVAVGSIDASGRLAFIKHISPAAWLISIFFKSKRWSHFASEKKRSLLSRQ